ncbi:hypothetical protein C8R47DRAFT_1221788 [Mycena vitilis]|nr:hypothetical protein C8R47DRAFT_1221788 [Mycena vitilis]
MSAPTHFFKCGVIAAEGSQAENTVPRLPTKWTTRTCDLLDCKKYEDLHKCIQCKIAMYCSKECQRADWKRHKPYCQMVTNSPPATDPETGGEHAFQRHLRLWTARFNGSLVCASIVAMRLNKRPSNIDNFGLVVTLQPRPHAEAGARFRLVSAVLTPLREMQALYMPGQLVQMHEQHRDELKAETNGLQVARRVANRASPVCVSKKMVRSARLTDPTLDWYISLKMQVDGNLPTQQIVG